MFSVTKSALRTTALAAAAIAAITGIAAAQGMDPLAAAVKARQSHMFLYQFNLMTLGGMAQGGVPYDTGAAQAAAHNLVALSGLDQSAYWLPGTAQGEIDGTRARPEIWNNIEDVMAKVQALNAAATTAAAATDLAGLQAAMGPLGAACGACHESYRAPQ